MKTARQYVVLTILLLCGQAWTAKAQDHTGPGGKVTLDEVKALIKNATTSEEHLKLAVYFRQEEAQRLESAKTHGELSEIYQFSKVPSPAVADMQRHCEDLVHAERNAASAARAMAEYHEEMADLLRKGH